MNQHINSEYPCIGGGFSGGGALSLHSTWRNAEVAMVSMLALLTSSSPRLKVLPYTFTVEETRRESHLTSD